MSTYAFAGETHSGNPSASIRNEATNNGYWVVCGFCRVGVARLLRDRLGVSSTSKAFLRCAKISAFPVAKHKQALPFATKKAFPACGGKGF
jgi:hypothetical protein